MTDAHVVLPDGKRVGFHEVLEETLIIGGSRTKPENRRDERTDNVRARFILAFDYEVSATEFKAGGSRNFHADETSQMTDEQIHKAVLSDIVGSVLAYDFPIDEVLEFASWSLVGIPQGRTEQDMAKTAADLLDEILMEQQAGPDPVPGGLY